MSHATQHEYDFSPVEVARSFLANVFLRPCTLLQFIAYFQPQLTPAQVGRLPVNSATADNNSANEAVNSFRRAIRLCSGTLADVSLIGQDATLPMATDNEPRPCGTIEFYFHPHYPVHRSQSATSSSSSKHTAPVSIPSPWELVPRARPAPTMRWIEDGDNEDVVRLINANSMLADYEDTNDNDTASMERILVLSIEDELLINSIFWDSPYDINQSDIMPVPLATAFIIMSMHPEAFWFQEDDLGMAGNFGVSHFRFASELSEWQKDLTSPGAWIILFCQDVLELFFVAVAKARKQQEEKAASSSKKSKGPRMDLQRESKQLVSLVKELTPLVAPTAISWSPWISQKERDMVTNDLHGILKNCLHVDDIPQLLTDMRSLRHKALCHCHHKYQTETQRAEKSGALPFSGNSFSPHDLWDTLHDKSLDVVHVPVL